MTAADPRTKELESIKELFYEVLDLYWLEQNAQPKLGAQAWALLSQCGRVMSGPHAGRFVSALPPREARALLDALFRGEPVAVHLLPRHRRDDEHSHLALRAGRLWVLYLDRSELAL